MTGGSAPDAADVADAGCEAPLPPLSAVIARHGLQPKRALGQHFLLDPSLCGRIARAARPGTSALILEVGPGPGGLTRALLTTGASRVVAVERDRRCVAALGELQAGYPDRLAIVEGDALAFDIATLGSARIGIVANLPYNVGTRLLLRWLERVERIESMTLMFQKEVAARITATGGRDYGGLSVRAQWLCTCERLFDVSPRAFVPPPGVVSTVVRLVPRTTPLAPADPAALDAVTRAAFGQRRKMLRRALRGLTQDPQALLESAGISPEARAETLSVAEFCALARAWAALRKS
ncbi:MAG: 16S rRNA (adenine(1518)-N(6)/adenine(1519)-N(6))-dimethyltransferase RsmA [Rhodospirillaceae bacterium]|nr:16S rRNA (adenine(1518)-N(6)/adenine(1519)-N(6))-dimethyltransferase RsmA [Rhodospirillaceae bacterium]